MCTCFNSKVGSRCGARNLAFAAVISTGFLGGVGTKTDFTNLQTILNSLRHAHAGLKLTWFS